MPDAADRMARLRLTIARFQLELAMLEEWGAPPYRKSYRQTGIREKPPFGARPHP